MRKQADPWRPSPGDLIQIWDYQGQADPNMETITGHGQLGYVVGLTADHKSTPSDPIFKVICFGNNSEVGEYLNVWHGWLHRVEKSSDVRKLSSETK